MSVLFFLWIVSGAMSLAYLAVKILDKPLRAGIDNTPLATQAMEVTGYISRSEVDDFVLIPHMGLKNTPVDENEVYYEAVMKDSEDRLWLTKAPFTLRDTAWLAPNTQAKNINKAIRNLPAVGSVVQVLPVSGSRVIIPEKLEVRAGFSGFVLKYFGYASFVWSALTVTAVVVLMAALLVEIN